MRKTLPVLVFAWLFAPSVAQAQPFVSDPVLVPGVPAPRPGTHHVAMRTRHGWVALRSWETWWPFEGPVVAYLDFMPDGRRPVPPDVALPEPGWSTSSADDMDTDGEVVVAMTGAWIHVVDSSGRITATRSRRVGGGLLSAVHLRDGWVMTVAAYPHDFAFARMDVATLATAPWVQFGSETAALLDDGTRLVVVDDRGSQSVAIDGTRGPWVAHPTGFVPLETHGRPLWFFNPDSRQLAQRTEAGFRMVPPLPSVPGAPEVVPSQSGLLVRLGEAFYRLVDGAWQWVAAAPGELTRDGRGLWTYDRLRGLDDEGLPVESGNAWVVRNAPSSRWVSAATAAESGGFAAVVNDFQLGSGTWVEFDRRGRPTYFEQFAHGSPLYATSSLVHDGTRYLFVSRDEAGSTLFSKVRGATLRIGPAPDFAVLARAEGRTLLWGQMRDRGGVFELGSGDRLTQIAEWPAPIQFYQPFAAAEGLTAWYEDGFCASSLDLITGTSTSFPDFCGELAFGPRGRIRRIVLTTVAGEPRLSAFDLQGVETVGAAFPSGAQRLSNYQSDAVDDGFDIRGVFVLDGPPEAEPMRVLYTGATGPVIPLSPRIDWEPFLSYDRLFTDGSGRTLVLDHEYESTDGLPRDILRARVIVAEHGASCGTTADCPSGTCVDGVCCDSACGGGDPTDCLACSIARGAARDGFCGPVVEGGPCDNPLACDGHETCAQGVCVPGTAPVCEDSDPCTASACVEPQGCVDVRIPGCVEDAGAGDAAMPDAGPSSADASIDATTPIDAGISDSGRTPTPDATRPRPMPDAGAIDPPSAGCGCRATGTGVRLEWSVVFLALCVARLRRRRAATAVPG